MGRSVECRTVVRLSHSESRDKIANNPLRIPHAYLHVIQSSYSGSRIKRFSLDEEGANGIEGAEVFLFPELMKSLKDSTVELPGAELFSDVSRESLAGCLEHFDKSRVSCSNHLEIFNVDEIEARSKVDDRTQDAGVPNFFVSAPAFIPCPTERSLRIILPKIEPMAEPVVVVVTGAKLSSTTSNRASERRVAAVIAKNIARPGHSWVQRYALVKRP